jgi:glycosyltransferase involved in cell wall biosynthesis
MFVKMNSVLPEAYVRGMVSIVIPTYNRARFIRESINSALAQDYPSFEVIVVDDGSTDDTPIICKEYGDRIRYFRKPNGGPASAKNFGIKETRGEWYKPLDSDDILETNALSTFMEYATKLGSKLLCCDAVLVDEKGHLLRGTRPSWNPQRDEFLRALWSGRSARRGIDRGGPAAGPGMIHRSIFVRVGLLNEVLRVGEDWEWHLRSNLVYGLHDTHVPKPLYRIRRHPEQITDSKSWSNRDKVRTEMMVHTIIRERMAKSKEMPRPLLEHYRAETQRLRRAYFPIVFLAKLLEQARGSHAFLPTLWRIAPETLDRIYWATNPPVQIAPRSCDFFLDTRKPTRDIASLASRALGGYQNQASFRFTTMWGSKSVSAEPSSSTPRFHRAT